MASIEVHFCRLDVSSQEEAELVGLLDAEELARADRFRFPRDRRRFTVRRGRARQWLARTIGGAPKRLAWATTIHGKPYLKGGPYFSLSHSNEMMMLAIGETELGCDIETIDGGIDWPPLARTFFSADEVSALDELEGQAAVGAFFACWTRKEAFVKAIGRGLSYPFDGFSVSVDANAAILSGGTGWQAHQVISPPAYRAALVSKMS